MRQDEIDWKNLALIGFKEEIPVTNEKHLHSA